MANYGALCAALALASLAGCGDPVEGGSSRAEFDGHIDPNCITVALAGVTDASPSSKTFSEHEVDNGVYYDWYYGKEINQYIEIYVQSNHVIFLNSDEDIGNDQSRARKFEPLMREVNAVIEKRCGLPISAHVVYHGF